VSTTLDRPLPLAGVPNAKDPRFLGRSPDFWICLGLIAVVLLVQGWNIADYPTVSDDEGTYMAQAWAVNHDIGMAPYTYWFDHPPLGWLQIAMLSWIPALIFHSHQLVVAYARIIMLPITGTTLALVYTLSRRMTLPRWAAVLAVLLCGLSPLSVTLQREIFLDNFATLWMLAAFVLAYSTRTHLWHHVAAGLCAGIAVLSKETMLVVAPALIVALWQNVHKATRKYSFVGFIGAFVLVGIQYPLYAVLKGELFPGNGHVSLIGGIQYQFGRVGSGSIFSPTSNAHSVFHAWLFYDSILIMGGVVATLLALLFRHLRPVALGGAILTLVAMRPSGYLPAMYVIQGLPFFAIAIAGVSDRLVYYILNFKARQVFWQQVTRLILVAACAASAAYYVVPRWYNGDRTAVTADPNAGYQAAAIWVGTHLTHPGNKRIVVDDALWLDMVNDGFKPSHRDIYFFKLDVDPSLMKTLPGWKPGDLSSGWQGIKYVVSTPYMRDNARSIPTLASLLDPKHYRVLWTWGTVANGDQIQVLEIHG
jgi:4-amino-4-deoxy-L-arabinose transferase-like glycosyltransferase